MWHLYFWIYYITSIWNKWKCERENQSLDSYLPEDYYDLNSTPNEAKYQFIWFGYITNTNIIAKSSVWTEP